MCFLKSNCSRLVIVHSMIYLAKYLQHGYINCISQILVHEKNQPQSMMLTPVEQNLKKRF